jgi:hypothetical protein
MLFALLDEIEAELALLETQSVRTELRLNQVTAALYVGLHLLQRFTGDEDVDAAIAKLLRLVQIINLTRTMLITLNAASGGWGLVFAGIGALGSVFTIGDLMGSVM